MLIGGRLGTLFGSGQLAADAVLAVVIFVVNTALMYSGRTRLLSLIPGMFFGFASYFATMFGGFGFAPKNAFAAWLCVVVMNGLGPIFAFVAHAVTSKATSEPANNSEMSAAEK